MTLSKAINSTIVTRFSSGRILNQLRHTSAGPPPVPPPAPDSIRYKWEKYLEKWPKIASLNKLVFDGSKWCLNDIKTYFNLRKNMLSGKTTIEKLSTSDLEVLVQTPSETLKALTIIVLLPLPATFYLIGFCVVFFPRIVLTRHFWTDDQRKEFFAMEINKSNTMYDGIHQALKEPKSIEDIKLPNVGELTLDLSTKISQLQGFYPIPFTNGRLAKRVRLLRRLDETLASYLDTLTSQQLLFHMYIRRLDYTNLSDDQIRRKLRDWVGMTSSLSDSAYLVAPVYFNKLRQ
ncbi:unnamed protein product [Auanema sp. JU1783]|nr:unnamed protein product [Auanema sp. JU1783]